MAAAAARLVWCVCAWSTCAGLRVAVPSRLRHSRCLLRASDKEPEPPCAATVMWPGILRSGRLGPVDVDADAVWITRNITQLSRRNLLRGAAWAAGVYSGSGTISGAYASGALASCASASGRLVHCVKPDERDTYATAQHPPLAQRRHVRDQTLRVLWVGAGTMKGVFENLFQAGNEVIALDIQRPDAADLRTATTYATEHGYRLRFEQGDATKLRFADGTFDVVMSSMFLCQDFNPEVVVSEIRRVLKPGGRFGFYEHVEDIDKVIVDKVFGERSVIRVQANPERTNVIAGVVRKV